MKEHSILVKVVVTDDEGSRDKIVKSTNFQTSIPHASLRATDPVQRNIEIFLKSHDIFYDRRKNFYKNQGKPSSKIVSIPLLSQVFAAIVLQEPHRARGKPSSLIKRDQDYQKTFSEDFDINIYLRCIQLLRFADEALSDHARPIRSNFRFHAAMLAGIVAVAPKPVDQERLIEVDPASVDKSVLKERVKSMIASAQRTQEESGRSLNTISKAAEFSETLK